MTSPRTNPAPDESLLRARYRLVAKIGCGFFVLLLAHNVLYTHRNQRDLPPHQRWEVYPRDLERTAELEPNPDIHSVLAVQYFMAKHMAGSEVLVTPALKQHEWGLTRVAQLRVQWSEAELYVDPKRARQLKTSKHAVRRWLMGWNENKKPVRVDIHFRFDGKGPYVLAQAANGSALFVLPRHLYPGVAVQVGS